MFQEKNSITIRSPFQEFYFQDHGTMITIIESESEQLDDIENNVPLN